MILVFIIVGVSPQKNVDGVGYRINRSPYWLHNTDNCRNKKKQPRNKKSGNLSVAALVARERLICASLRLMSLYLLKQPKPARKHDTMYRFYFLLTPLQVNLQVTPENKNTEQKSGVSFVL